MDPIIWIIVALVGAFGFGTTEVEATSSGRLGPPPWVTGGIDDQAPKADTGPAEPSSAPDPTGAQRLVHRAPYASCGEVELDRMKAPNTDLETGWACLTNALADERGAELVTTFFTIEGDPIHEYHRVTPSGSYEYFGDSREDAFGSRTVTYRRCPADERFAEQRPPGPACMRS